ncbi:MAG TPA: ATP-binding cassette domain-containing protein, partial [Thermodesulfobacteriaceae bacterium]|nr:ATP-binding cassette domain-containing protein [Thermodesulfobacteriaceae bacterium]
FTFERGKFYAVTGPNGCGKTTLSKLIMGINRPASGLILFEGEDITGLSLTERARKGIAFSFQHPARFKGMTFRDLLSISAGISDEDKLVGILARVGICSMDFLDKPVDNKLSGGEIKKIELATTIARNPRFAIYDEPDTGIDLWTIGPMVDLIAKECRDHDTTTVVISHNEKFLEAADEVVLIRDGVIARTGDMKSIMPFLKSMDFCSWGDICKGEADVRCHR